ncbi:phage tail tape measure protein (plasmid) [Pseudomonas luteola]|uniref:phage tail tape measure protein n=1 Tax=Pseudomonas luteola TaxID=47886 RepID=UPI00388EB660
MAANNLQIRVLLSALDKVTSPLKRIMAGSNATARALKDTRDKLKQLNAQQSDIGNYRKQHDAVRQTGEELARAQQKLRQYQEQLKATDAPSAAFQRTFINASAAVERLKNKHTEQRAELQRLIPKLREAGVDTRNLAGSESQLKSRIEATTQAYKRQQERMKAIAQQQERLGRMKQSYEKTKGVAGSMAGSGAGMLAGGSGILYAGSKLLAPGLDFDASMSRVQALTRLDKNSDEYKALRKQSRDLGASTQFTAGQAADAQGYLAMAGFNPKAIQDAMPGMLDLAKAGGSELADTADIASNILTGFKLQAKDMGQVGDVLVGTFTRSNTDLRMLGETMKYVAPVAASLNQPLEVVAAMAGKLGDAGIQGSMGGTALRGILSRLAAPSKAAGKALNQLGVKAKDAKGNLRSLPDILADLSKKTKGMGNAKVAGLFKDIAGEEAVSGLQVLVEQAGKGELQAFIKTLKASSGEASKTSKVMADNMRGDLDGLSSAWEDLGIQMEEGQDAPLRGLIQNLTGVVGKIKAWTVANPELTNNLVKGAAVVAAITAGMGTLTLAIASVLGPFALMRYGMGMLGLRGFSLIGTLLQLAKGALPLVATGIRLVTAAAMANPILALITGIALAATLIYQNWGTVGPWFASLWQEIKNGFNGGLTGILQLLANFSPIGLMYSAWASVLSYVGIELPTKFTGFGGMIIDGLINGMTGQLGALKDSVFRVAGNAAEWFKEKTGIHSPSRVFAQLGDFTMQGLAVGIAKGEDGPLSQMASTAKRLTAAGAVAVGVTTTATPAMAGITFDDRPPISQKAAPAPVTGDTYNFTINAAPGMDAQAIAKAVRAELARAKSEQSARGRSSLRDQE